MEMRTASCCRRRPAVVERAGRVNLMPRHDGSPSLARSRQTVLDDLEQVVVL